MVSITETSILSALDNLDGRVERIKNYAEGILFTMALKGNIIYDLYELDAEHWADSEQAVALSSLVRSGDVASVEKYLGSYDNEGSGFFLTEQGISTCTKLLNERLLLIRSSQGESGNE